MPYRDKFLTEKQRSVLLETEKQLPNLHFEVYNDAFLVLRPMPKLCLNFPLNWLDAGVEILVSEITKDTQFKQ